MGIRSEDGWIYFNELLYRCMRKQYCTFKLNKTMTLFEINIQFKVLMKRMEIAAKEKKDDQNTYVN